MDMGSTDLSMRIFIGAPVIFDNEADDVLKLLAEQCSTSQALNFGTFSSVGGKGISSGLSGVGSVGLITSSLSSSLLSLLSVFVRENADSASG